MAEQELPKISVIGMVGGEVFGAAAAAAMANTSVLVGSPRHLAHVETSAEVERVDLVGALPPLLDRIAEWREKRRAVCVLASGDPSFFGIARTLATRFSAEALTVFAAPSSISLAFASQGWSFEDAVVASAHGRALEPAISQILAHPKVAVLTSPTHTPERVGQALLPYGIEREVAVVTRIGEADERAERMDLGGLANGSFDPMSVVILVEPQPSPRLAAFGRGEDEFATRKGMITKAEVRAVALSKLRLPRSGVLWDVGAGSGSVGIEAAGLVPGLQVFSVEKNPEDAARIRENALRHRVRLTVVEEEAPGGLVDLPAPDRIFVGGGGLAVLDACVDRLAKDGRMVAAHIVLEHALGARERLGQMIQLRVDRAEPIGELGSRLVPQNPVFLSWGPT